MLVTITGEPVPGRDEAPDPRMISQSGFRPEESIRPVGRGTGTALAKAEPQGIGLYILAAGLFALIALTLGVIH